MESFPLEEAALASAIVALGGEGARVREVSNAPDDLPARRDPPGDSAAWVIDVDGPNGPFRALARLRDGATAAPRCEPVTVLRGGWASVTARLACFAHGDRALTVAMLPSGESYGYSIHALASARMATADDLERARAVGEALVSLHLAPVERADDADARRMFDGPIGVAAALDALARAPRPVVSRERLASLETAFVAWRWRASARAPRLSRVHGACTPDLVVIEGRRVGFVPSARRGVGDPTEDVSTLALALLAAGVDDGAAWADGLFPVWRELWASYLAASGDYALLDVAPPFLAWRALLLAAGLTHGPTMARVRERLVAFAEQTLASRTFDPDAHVAWVGVLAHAIVAFLPGHWPARPAVLTRGRRLARRPRRGKLAAAHAKKAWHEGCKMDRVLPKRPQTPEPPMTTSSATSATVPFAPARAPLGQDRKHRWAVEGREAAVDFVEGVRKGWSPEDFLMWCRRRLLLRGAVRLLDPVSGRIHMFEPGVERVTVPTSPSDRLDPMYAAPLGRLMETARSRVVTTLGGMLGAPLDDRFVSAAIYAGRVRRARGDSGETGWEPYVTEGEPLSTWVLALFAVDALSGREDYDRHLHVCEVCGSVAFGLGGNRRRCGEHRESASIAPSSRVQRSARPTRTDETLPRRALAVRKSRLSSPAVGARCAGCGVMSGAL